LWPRSYCEKVGTGRTEWGPAPSRGSLSFPKFPGYHDARFSNLIGSESDSGGASSGGSIGSVGHCSLPAWVEELLSLMAGAGEVVARE